MGLLDVLAHTATAHVWRWDGALPRLFLILVCPRRCRLEEELAAVRKLLTVRRLLDHDPDEHNLTNVSMDGS